MMDEERKKHLARVWLRVLYLSLWSIGLVAVLATATWLLGLWRYAAFAVVGIAIGAYVCGRGDSLVAQITRALLVIGTAAFAAYLALVAARNPSQLIPLAMSIGTFGLYGAATVATTWLVRAVAPRAKTAEARREEQPIVEVPEAAEAAARALEAVPETEAEEGPGAVTGQ